MKVLKKIKESLKDLHQIILRIFPGKFQNDEKNNISFSQIYPYGINIDKLLKIESKNLLKDLNYKSEFRISSIGTCFAEEVSKFFNSETKYNYLNLEKNLFDYSANWGRVFTTKNLEQVLLYSLTNKIPIYKELYKGNYFDPLREWIVGLHRSEKELVNEIISHRANSKKVFINTDLLIITVGQNETWYDFKKDIVWGRIPPFEMRKKFKTLKPIEFSLEENIVFLNTSIDLLKKFNKNLKIIFTVSPVFQNATFLSDNIISKSFSAKCLLKTAVDKVVNSHENVFYFPSFEAVLTDNPHSFNADNMHIKRKKVNQIMSLIDNSLF